MKKIFFMTLLALASLSEANAQGSINIGYCDGQESAMSDISFNTDNAWGHAAIQLTPEQLSSYVGGDITGARVALVSRVNLDSLCIWVKNSLDGEPICADTITSSSNPKILRGWNETTFNTPHRISEGETLFVGYSYKQRSPVATVSYVDAVADGAFWIKLGDEGFWTDMSDKGALSVEAVISGNSLPQYDMKMKSASARWQNDGSVIVEATVRNNAMQTINGFSLNTSIQDFDECFTNVFANVVAPSEEVTVFYMIKPSASDVGTVHPLIVSIAELGDGKTDENKANDDVMAIFSYQRKVMIEEFTTEQCLNCPKMAEYIEQVMTEGNYAERTAMATHHSGFYTDWLTSADDQALLWLFNSSSYYTPAMMFDRHAYSKNSNGGGVPTLFVDSPEGLKSYIDGRLQVGASSFLSLDVEKDGENQNKMTAHVSGGRSAYSPFTDRITIYVIENGIEAKAQQGVTSLPFYHNHVVRLSNATWGEPIEWKNDNTFDYTFSFEVESGWNVDNMSVIAFISGYDEDEQGNCEIDNCESIALGKGASGIELTEVKQKKERWYTLSGVEVTPSSSLPRGIYIVNGKKILR